MAASPDPSLAYVAPPINITVPAGAQPGGIGQVLRLRITPHLLLPSPPFSPAVRTLKAVEGYVKTVVLVGHRIECSVCLEDSSGGPGGGLDTDSPAAQEVVSLIRTALSKAFDAACRPAGTAKGPLPSQTSCAPLPPPASDHFTFTTRSAQSRESDLLSGLILPGLPRAFLTKLEISCIWVNPAAKDQTPALKPGTPKPDASEEEDEMAPDTDQEQEEARQPSANEAEVSCIPDAITRLQSFDLSADPPWRDQLSEALKLLLGQQLARRFPLVFDSRVPEFAETISIPRALTASVSSFRHASAKHNTDLSGRMGQLLYAIRQHQSSRIASVAHEAANIPELVSKKRDFVKKRAMQERRERKAQKRFKKRDGDAHDNSSIGNMNHSKTATTVDLLDPEARIQAYLEAAGAKLHARCGADTTVPDADLVPVISQALLWMAASSYFTPKKTRWRQRANRVNVGDRICGLIDADASEKNNSDPMRDRAQAEDQLDGAISQPTVNAAEYPTEDPIAKQHGQGISDFEWADDTDGDHYDQGDLDIGRTGLSPRLEIGIAASGGTAWNPEQMAPDGDGEVPQLGLPSLEVVDPQWQSSDDLCAPHETYRDTDIDTDESLPDLLLTPSASMAIYGIAPLPGSTSLQSQTPPWHHLISNDDVDSTMSDDSESFSYEFDRMSMAPDSDKECSVYT